MWIELTDVNGERITINFDHVVSYNAYGTGAHIVTTTPDLTFFVKEDIDTIQQRIGIKPAG
ncbi:MULTISPECIES: hypothetical protein [Phyllobacteriaceae]|uniref:Flagellar protein FlbD n=1 Tax=Phyllobacterium phragmitis TaxID=2670329 RepID=A0ABQ0H030_9HYPH|nr:hypothetical protein [Mesorhizobium sp. RMAD-H1]MBB2970901.1 uncharacterized protein YlzI (FlbEa/FlbD family) [Mesorhizobium sp. RMAD-H1]